MLPVSKETSNCPDFLRTAGWLAVPINPDKSKCDMFGKNFENNRAFHNVLHDYKHL
jgi:hypothetical protein